MSEELRDDNGDETTAEHPGEGEGEGDGSKERKVEGATPRVGLHGMLTRDSDVAARPGFRNPPNARTKAQKSGRKGKKKR